MQTRQSKEHAAAADPQWPRWFRVAIGPFIESSALYPVLAAVLGHVALLIAMLLLDLARDRSLAAVTGLLAVSLLSAEGIRLELRARGRLGRLSAVIGATWVLGALVAWLARRYHVY